MVDLLRIICLWTVVLLMWIIALPLFLAILTFATLLWPLCLIWSLINWFIGLFTKKKSNTEDFQEFIFLCYGVAALCLLFPLSIGGDL